MLDANQCAESSPDDFLRQGLRLGEIALNQHGLDAPTYAACTCVYMGYIMCMSLTHRLQVLLDEEQYARLSTLARTENRSIGSLIRQAVDQVWTTPDEEKVALLEAILAEQPMPVPDPEELSRELDSIRGERFLGV